MRLAVVVCVVLCFADTACRGQDALETRLRSEMPKALNQLDKRFMGTAYEIESEFTDSDTGDGKPTVIYRSHIKTSGNYATNEFHGDLRYASRRVYDNLEGVNGDYVFKLEQNRNKTSWLLTDVCDADDPRADKLARESVKRAVVGEASLASSVRIFGTTTNLIELFARPDLVVSRVNKKNGRVVAEFRYTLPPDDPSGAGNVQTTMTFDPNQHWVPTEWRQTLDEAKSKSTLHVTRQVEVTDDTFAVKYVREGESLTKDKGGKPSRTKTTGSFRATMRDIPESEFRLPFYGVPEPPEFQPKPTPLWVWLVAAFGVLALLAVAFRLIARRGR